MRRRKPLLAPLQETNPRTTMGRDLPIAIEEQSCWTTDQGSANSRRSSPGSGASTPLRGALDRHLLLVHPRSSLITPLPLFHPFLAVALPPGPHFAAIHPRAAWPPDPAKLAPSFAATDTVRGLVRGADGFQPLQVAADRQHLRSTSLLPPKCSWMLPSTSPRSSLSLEELMSCLPCPFSSIHRSVLTTRPPHVAGTRGRRAKSPSSTRWS